MTQGTTSTRVASDSASTGELVTRLSEQVSTLVKDELALARAEMTEKGKRAGAGAGLIGGGTVLALYGVGLLLVTIVAALDLAWPTWVAALVVTVVVFAVAAVLAVLGRNQVKKAAPPVPERAKQSVADDVDAVKAAVKEGRRS
jgi:uncharacterized membrane protein YqjE